MEGIEEVFAGFAAWEQQEFDWQFAAESTRARRLADKCLWERMRYRTIKSNPAKYRALLDYQNKRTVRYRQQRRASDPVWAAEFRRKRRDERRRQRARQREARAA